jgi:trimethylamine--corrinoid protein Co-methyltransferase
MAHFRERWYPDVFETGNLQRWEAKGAQSLGERAAERVEEILSTHTPEPLPEKVRQEIRAVVERAKGA